jgi:4-hydroxythreonine-4-phosphate dehydrogenase
VRRPPPRLIVTSGEPAGIGPELCLRAALRDWPAELVFAGDPSLFARQAAALGLGVQIDLFDPARPPAPQRPGRLLCQPVALAAAVHPGRLDVANAGYVLALIDEAVAGCRDGRYAAMVTAPVQKSVINDAGVVFPGHTEYLAAALGGALPVMLLVADTLRVALATTHLPLAQVPAAITPESLGATLDVLDAGLRRPFGIERPRILVLGLNPHAGENGHLGLEERSTIEPAIAAARARGIDARGPVPADTAFTPGVLAEADAVLAMYHDQGLPVLKHVGFGHAVNVTLGLPIVRTSVDHGTALDLAGSGRADAGSLFAAIELATTLAAP